MICDQLRKADLARLKVEMRALELGVVCSRPVIEGTRYDCILDTGTHLYRAQVKYGNGIPTAASGAVAISLTRVRHNNRSKSPERAKFNSPAHRAGYDRHYHTSPVRAK